MSHSSGNVTFIKDGLIMHCEYDGTSDIMVPALWDTEDEMSDHWRESVRNKCTCGNFEPVVIYSDYGSGFEWEGEACRTCKAINHEHLDPCWKENKEYREQQKNPWGFTPVPEVELKIKSGDEWKPIEAKVERKLTEDNAENFNGQLETQKGIVFPSNPFSGTITLEDVNLSSLAKNLFAAAEMQPPLDIVVRKFHIKGGVRPLRSKKKRIVKKWHKKNMIVEEETLFTNCTIIGGSL